MRGEEKTSATTNFYKSTRIHQNHSDDDHYFYYDYILMILYNDQCVKLSSFHLLCCYTNDNFAKVLVSAVSLETRPKAFIYYTLVCGI